MIKSIIICLIFASSVLADRPYPEEYKILQIRNIFSRGIKESTTQPTTLPAKFLFIIRGITEQGGEFTVLIENKTTGKTLPFQIKDKIIDKEISSINMEGIVLKGKEERIKIGEEISFF